MANLTDILGNPEEYVGGFVVYLLIACSIFLIFFGWIWRRKR